MKVLPNNVKDYIAPAQKDTDEATFDPVAELKESETVAIGFTSGGNPDVPCPTCDADSKECFAKKVTINSKNGLRDVYYMKVGQNGVAFDPWGTFSEGSQHQFARLQGKDVWNFVEVSKRAFEFYKTFLQTRNKAWKINAEREMVNSYQSTRRTNDVRSRATKFIGGK